MFFIVELLIGLFQTYEIWMLYQCYYKECRYSRKVEFIFYAIMYLMMNIPYLLWNVPMLTALFSFVGEAGISFIYKGSLKKNLLTGVMTFSFYI